MVGRNGVLTLPSSRRVLKLHPETITYEIERDGETVSLAGYKKGPGCPLPVLIEVDEALAAVSENEPSDADQQAMSSRRYYAQLMYAERTLRRMMLQAVIPGMTVDDANILASDDGSWKDILIELGWRQADAEIVATEDAADPEVVGESVLPTGDAVSPDSSPRTPGKTR